MSTNSKKTRTPPKQKRPAAPKKPLEPTHWILPANVMQTLLNVYYSSTTDKFTLGELDNLNNSIRANLGHVHIEGNAVTLIKP